MTKQIQLTEKRARYAANRKQAKFVGTRLAYNAAVQERYVDALTRLVKQMTAQTIREVRNLFKSTGAYDHAMDADIASQARILTNKLTAKFESLFGRNAKELAERMAKAADLTSRKALGTSLKQLSGGVTLKTDIMTRELRTVVTATVAENVALIKSIPTDYLFQVKGDILRAITTGQGLADIVPALEQYEGVTLRRARNIALDQTRKAYNNINKGRMQAIGVKKFEWVHSGGGQKPRELHIQMDGNVYSFDDLPVIDERTGERGIPGQAINCRCTMIPVIEFDGAESD
jgi:SPP1 gp7 family putative phage head morphogenesis protein